MATHPWGAVAQLAAAQHGVLSSGQAADIGITRSQIRTLLAKGWLEPVHPGVLRVAASPRSWHQQLRAATLAGGGTVASHRAAARLHGLDGLTGDDVLEVSVERPRHPRLDGVVVHRVAELGGCDVTAVDGIPVTSLARTLSDLGASVRHDDAVERALDDALRRGASARWIEEVHRRQHRPGPSGTGRLARVLELPDRRGATPGSWRERVTQRLLAHPELELVRQFEIRDTAGQLIARPDLAVVDARVGIEYHSDQWHFGPRRGRRDRRRDLAAARAGWELLYLDASDHPEPAAAVDAVLDVVRLRRAAGA